MKSGKVKRGKAMVAFNILSYGGVGFDCSDLSFTFYYYDFRVLFH